MAATITRITATIDTLLHCVRCVGGGREGEGERREGERREGERREGERREGERREGEGGREGEGEWGEGEGGREGGREGEEVQFQCIYRPSLASYPWKHSLACRSKQVTSSHMSL